MRILLLTLGSHGDIHPFFALARELTARGHRAVVATNPTFAAQAERAGIAFEPLTEHADLQDILQTPDVMHPMKGARVVLRELTLPLVPEIYGRTLDLITTHTPDAIVSHPICLGAPWAAEKMNIPVVSAALAPISWMQSRDPIVFGPWRSHNPSPFAARFDAWVGRRIMRFMLDGPLNKVRRSLGLPKRRDLLISEFIRPGLNLGLWSPHFRPPAPGDPEGSVICGFPWFDDHHDHQTDTAELDAFLSDGDPPIVFTLGTAAVHVPGNFYAEAIRAAQQLNRRAVLLVGRSEYAQKLGNLPRSIRAFTYAPFSTLLPRACATVHHGGIGTTAQALRAGKPTVIVPLAHDQFDNAARAKRLGVSETLFHSRVTSASLAAALRTVLSDPELARRAAKLGQNIASENGALVASGHLERTFGGVSPTTGK